MAHGREEDILVGHRKLREGGEGALARVEVRREAVRIWTQVWFLPHRALL